MAEGYDINPLIPGKKQCAIFGFCDIRNFTDSIILFNIKFYILHIRIIKFYIKNEATEVL